MQTALFGLERSVYARIARLVREEKAVPYLLRRYEDMLTPPSVAKTARRYEQAA